MAAPGLAGLTSVETALHYGLWNHEYMVTLTCGKSLGTGRTYQGTVEAFLARA